MQNQNNRWIAFLAYIPVVGWLLVWGMRRSDELAVFHARQSVALTVLAVVIPLIWLVFALLVTAIPYAGPVIAVSSFALVVLTFLYLGVMWLMGFAHALQGKQSTLPLVNRVTVRIFG